MTEAHRKSGVPPVSAPRRRSRRGDTALSLLGHQQRVRETWAAWHGDLLARPA